MVHSSVFEIVGIWFFSFLLDLLIRLWLRFPLFPLLYAGSIPHPPVLVSSILPWMLLLSDSCFGFVRNELWEVLVPLLSTFEFVFDDTTWDGNLSFKNFNNGDIGLEDLHVLPTFEFPFKATLWSWNNSKLYY